MSVTIQGVQPASAAHRKGIRPQDVLDSVNGHAVMDVLDYQFYVEETKLRLELRRADKKFVRVIRKAEGEDIGLEFDSYLMDKERHCRNQCVFCFIDQLPKGMRESLYFKDDDSRLSFLFGNYITLTNLSQHEIDRIKTMHISPVNVSVHTTNPELRVRMMKNKNAGNCLRLLGEFAQADIKMNTQLVLCPGLNDGEELSRSLRDLSALYPAVQSIAAVPLGMTKHREGLPELTPFDEQSAGAVLDIIEDFGDKFLREQGTRLCFPADEFYLKAGRSIPPPDFYEEFAQLENGVGMWASFKQEFEEAMENIPADYLPPDGKLTLATATSAAKLMRELIDLFEKRWHNRTIQIIPIVNHFFGTSINVAGLLTGGDLIAQLQGVELGEELLIPASMLRHEGDVFLDDLTPQQVADRLQTKVTPVVNDGGALLQAWMGEGTSVSFLPTTKKESSR